MASPLRLKVVILAVTGAVLMVLGAILVPVTDAVIRLGVRSATKVDTKQKFEDRLTAIRSTYDTRIFNITNLREVLEDGAKPHVTEHEYKMRYLEENFDMEFRDDKKSFVYKSWWTYVPWDDETEARMREDTFVNVNPVYLGSVAEFGNQESLMFVGLSYLAVDLVVQILDSFMASLAQASVADYAEGTPEELLNISRSDEYARWWAQRYGINASSWEQLRNMQFGNGTVTRALYAMDSVLPLELPDVLVAPEIFGAYNVEMTADQAGAFLDTFSNATLSVQFVTQLTQGTVDLSDWPVVDLVTTLTYLYVYLPESLFLKGYVVGYVREPLTSIIDPRGEFSLRLLADGTGTHNSGLFTRRSAYEMLFGYHDRIFDLVPPELSTREFVYYGLLEFQYESVEAQRQANPPLIYEEYTGKKNLQNVRQYALWRNRTVVQTRDEYPTKTGAQASCATWEAQGYESCDIFLQVIDPRDVAKAQTGPFHDRPGTLKSEFKFWVPEGARVVDIEFDKYVTVRGIETRKYTVKDDNLYTSNCDDFCNPDNARYRMDGPSFTWNMATVQGGAPAVLSYPVLGRVSNETRDLFDGLPDYREGQHETFLCVEPLTGFIIKGHKRLQYNWQLQESVFDANPWSLFFQRSDNIYVPYAWTDDNDRISGKDARSFKRVIYGSMNFAIAFTVILIVIGVILVVAAYVVHRRLSAVPTAEAKPIDDPVKTSDIELVASEESKQ